MKNFNIQRDYLKKMIKKERVAFQEDGDCIYITDGFIAHKFLKEECFLNLDNQTSNVKTFDVKYFLDNERFAKLDLNLTNYMQSADKCSMQKLKSEDGSGVEVWVNSNYLKNFENPTFKGSESLKPVLVYENNELMGFIMPMRA